MTIILGNVWKIDENGIISVNLCQDICHFSTCKGPRGGRDCWITQLLNNDQTVHDQNTIKFEVNLL